jgi:drug/metabolite transporter (DMT)-like permease
MHALRLVGAFVALSCGIWAVAVLPLTTAITLGFAQVFFVSLLAIWVLRERVGIHRIGAVIVGFIGVVVVMRPGVHGIINLHALIPIAAALGAAIAIISVRTLSQTESTATLLIYQSVFCWRIGRRAAVLVLGDARLRRHVVSIGHECACYGWTVGGRPGASSWRG